MGISASSVNILLFGIEARKFSDSEYLKNDQIKRDLISNIWQNKGILNRYSNFQFDTSCHNTIRKLWNSYFLNSTSALEIIK